MSTNHLTFPPITFSRMAVLLSLEASGDFDERKELLSHIDKSHEIRKLLGHLLAKRSDCCLLYKSGRQATNQP